MDVFNLSLLSARICCPRSTVARIVLAVDVTVIVVPVLMGFRVRTDGKTVEARDTEIETFGVPEEFRAVGCGLSVPDVLVAIGAEHCKRSIFHRLVSLVCTWDQKEE